MNKKVGNKHYQFGDHPRKVGFLNSGSSSELHTEQENDRSYYVCSSPVVVHNLFLDSAERFP